MRIRLVLLLTLIVSVTPIVPSGAADRGDRFALVIGNSKYPDAEAPLKEPINDARDVADELKRNGFNVEVGENLTGDAMRHAFDRLYGRIKPGSVALIFFSGFGVQSSRQSYMIPIDAQIWTEADVRRDGLSLETVLGELNSRGAGVKIALIDASRRNPFERRFRSFSAGLAPVIAPNGTLVMYSAALSSVISDNGSDHSLFVQTAAEGNSRSGPDGRGDAQPHPRRRHPCLPQRAGAVDLLLAGRGLFVHRRRERAAVECGRRTSRTAGPRTPAAAAVAAQRPVAAAEGRGSASRHQAAEKNESPAIALADDPTIKSLTARLADNPDDQNALYRRGQVYASKGAYALAIKDFDGSIRLNPKDVEAFNNRCWARTVIGDLQAALKDCNEALRMRPSFVDALDSRGLVNLKSGMTKNAIADFDAALKINPRLTSSLYGRGLAKKRSGAIAAGDLDIANAKAMDPNIVKEFADYGVN